MFRSARTARRTITRSHAFALTLAAGGAISLAAPALGASDLPVERVTLYRSGVGYFEHGGEVTGDASIDLRFATDRINDVLKSLVAFDLSGGEVGGVRYEHKAPLGQRMRRFSVRPGGSTADLLKQLRGERIRLHTEKGSIEGALYGVEDRIIAARNDWGVSILTDEGLRMVPSAEIRSFELLDESLAKELREAMSTMAEHRADDRSQVTIDFRGEGERRVAIGYTMEAPVWKTSYRLVLPEATGGEPTIHAWAIVENTTDSDWEGVELALAAGRPVSFTMDLQSPHHLQRPNLPAPTTPGARPVTYDDAWRNGFEEADRNEARMEQAVGARARGQAEAYRRSAFAAEAPGALADAVPEEAFKTMLSGAGVSAGEVGEQFFFRLDAPAHVERGGSAMLPIMSAPIEGRRVTIWSPGGESPLPMRGVEIVNDSENHLMPGPIAVYDAGRYAGDAMIQSTSRNQRRLLSYAVDQDLRAALERDADQEVRSLRIVDGSLHRRMRHTRTSTHILTNHDGERPRTVLIEHPRQQGWTLAEDAEPVERTETHDRFEVTVEPGETVRFPVVLERIERETLGVTSVPMETLLVYSQRGAASQEVVEAIRRAAEMQSRVATLERRVESLEAERTRIFADQSRIRDNMHRVGRGSDLWERYERKLNEQESRLEALAQTTEQAQRDLAAARRALGDYLRDLTVE